MSTHVRVVAALFLVFGGLLTLGALVSSLFFGGLGALVAATAEQGSAVGALILQFTGAALTVFLLVLSVPSLICGWGLLKTRPWARTLGIVLAAVALVNFWLGTVFGVYALWVLLNKRSEALFGD